MTKPTLINRIEALHVGRDPVRLKMKYRAMADDAFSFLRGTNPLFNQDWPIRSALNSAPIGWICGDLHLENFGAYRGDNRLTYFDLNDFDEAALAPCTWDLARFVTSLLVAADNYKLGQNDALTLSHEFLDAYSAELAGGKARWIERATARGMIRALLKNLKQRSHSSFLADRTKKEHDRLSLRVDGNKALPCTRAEYRKVARMIERISTKHREHPLRVLDVGRRIAGLGALGLERYVALVEAEDVGSTPLLLDIKYQPGSSLTSHLKAPQPAWTSEALRVVTLQTRGQAIPPAFLHAVTCGDRSYVIRELLPQQDRLHLKRWNGKIGSLRKVVRTMGEVVAWTHLRGSGRQGSASADEWVRFGRQNGWRKPLLDHAMSYAGRTLDYWENFARDARTIALLDA